MLHRPLLFHAFQIQSSHHRLPFFFHSDTLTVQILYSATEFRVELHNIQSDDNGRRRTSISLPVTISVFFFFFFFSSSQRHLKFQDPQTPLPSSHFQLPLPTILHCLQTNTSHIFVFTPPPPFSCSTLLRLGTLQGHGPQAQGLRARAVQVLSQGSNQERTLAEIPGQVAHRLAQLPVREPRILRL